jgi:hypothetical protein
MAEARGHRWHQTRRRCTGADADGINRRFTTPTESIAEAAEYR